AAEVAVLYRVFVRPERLAGCGVEAQHTLGAIGLAVVLALRSGRDRRFEVEREDAAVRDRDAGVPAADRLLPDALRPGGRPLLGKFGSVPGAVGPRPTPPRPVLARRVRRSKKQSHECHAARDLSDPLHDGSVSPAPWFAPLLFAASMNAMISSVSVGSTGGLPVLKNSTIFLSSSR